MCLEEKGTNQLERHEIENLTSQDQPPCTVESGEECRKYFEVKCFISSHSKFDTKIVFEVVRLGDQLFELHQADVAASVEVCFLQNIPDHFSLEGPEVRTC